jgi:hypothetical protein
MSDSPPKGRPLAIDPKAKSASPSAPAFVAPPDGAPVYYGFPVLQDVSIEDFTFGAITDFEAEPCDQGDAFVIAPDGARAGLVWEVSTRRYIEAVLPFERGRWGVWAISFPYPMKNRDSARQNLAVVLPELRGRWEDWKRWMSQNQ